jgi:pimeloyl-ACP methyl ester carboxylesterase
MKLAQRVALGYIRTKFKLLSSISKKKAAQHAFELFCTPVGKYRKPLPPIFEQAEKLRFSLDGTQVYGWRWNFPAKPKVMILHGFESSVAKFDRYIRPLIKKGYEVLAFDAPAHGRSGGKRITAPLYKKMIVEINNRYGPVDSFLAHSLGGLAVCLALEELPHTTETRLVLVAPAAETVTAIDSFFKFLQLDPGLREEFDAVILRKGGKKPAWYSINRAIDHIKAKVLWIQDEDDDTTPLSDILMVRNKNRPNLRFVITKGLGHRRIYRDNQVMKAITEFL